MTDRLTDAIEEAVRGAEGGSYYPTVDFHRAARDSLTAIQSALGPDQVLTADGVKRLETRGVDYCTKHHGLRMEDEPACDFCVSTDGPDDCTLVPLHTITQEERP